MPEKEGGQNSRRRGRAVLLKTSKGIFPFSHLQKYEQKEGKTKQVDVDRKILKAADLVEFPFAVSTLIELQENCSYFEDCTRQIGIDTVGAGWKFDHRIEGKDLDPKTKAELENFFSDTNSKGETFAKILERAIDDYQAIGWLAIEVSRNKKLGEPNGLFHIPAHTIYWHKSGRKLCQVRDQEKSWFKPFGMDYEVDRKTGEEKDSIPEDDDRANEVIFAARYYRRTKFYGAPPILPALGAVIGMIGIRDYNLAFFENYGIPAALIILEGDEWEEGTLDTILNFMNVEIKGAVNAHRTMAMEAPEGCKVHFIPLSTEVKEGSFRLIKKDLRDEVLAAYRMPPYRIGIAEVGALGGSTAPESTKIYNSALISPMKRDLAALITATIIREGFDKPDATIKFNSMDTRDLDAEIGRYEKLFGMAVINGAYIAERMGITIDAEKEPHFMKYFLDSRYTEVGLEPEMAEKRDIETAVGLIHRRVEKQGDIARIETGEIRGELQKMVDRILALEEKKGGLRAPVSVGRPRKKSE